MNRKIKQIEAVAVLSDKDEIIKGFKSLNVLLQNTKKQTCLKPMAILNETGYDHPTKNLENL